MSGEPPTITRCRAAPQRLWNGSRAAACGHSSSRSTRVRAAYLERYTAALVRAYPTLSDGSVLLPFPRLFMVAIR